MQLSTEDSAQGRRTPRRHWLAALKVVLTAGLLGGLLVWADLDEVGRAMRGLNVGLALAAAALFFLQAVVLALRWKLIAQHFALAMTLRQSVHWVLVGLFLNLALPTSIGGDGFRVWKLHRESGGSLADAMLTVIIERGTGLVLLALLVSLASLSLHGAIANEKFAVLAALGPAALLLSVPLWFAPRIARHLGSARIAATLRRMGTALDHLLAQPWLAVAILALGVASSGIGLAAGWLLTRALGMGVQPLPAMALIGAASIIAVLPVSLGGWGVREASMVGLFGLLAVPAASAVTLSLLLGALPIAISAPAALAWALSNARRVPQTASSRHP